MLYQAKTEMDFFKMAAEFKKIFITTVQDQY
jgi:hypothetical protein